MLDGEIVKLGRVQMLRDKLEEFARKNTMGFAEFGELEQGFAFSRTKATLETGLRSLPRCDRAVYRHSQWAYINSDRTKTTSILTK